jgi:hypothetical protein
MQPEPVMPHRVAMEELQRALDLILQMPEDVHNRAAEELALLPSYRCCRVAARCTGAQHLPHVWGLWQPGVQHLPVALCLGHRLQHGGGAVGSAG